MRISFSSAALIAGLFVVGVGIAWSLWPRPVVVETAAVVRGRFVATVDEDGKTRIRDRYVITAPLGGRLDRVRLKSGDTVVAGDVVATLAPPSVPLLDARSRREAEERLGTAEATRERTRAAVERAQAEASQAKTERDRTRTLQERGSATVQALERAEVALRVADRDLRGAEFLDHAAEHELGQSKAVLAKYFNGGESPERWNVVAPVGGVILRVLQESEMSVQSGAPLMEIGDAQDIEVVADVLSTDAVEIRPGANVTLERWGGPGSLTGRVRRVEPAAFTKVSTLGVEEQRVNVVIDLLTPIEQRSSLGDGFQLDARITVYVNDDAIIVPAGALFRRGENWSVFVVREGRARAQNVDLLRRSGRSAALSGGVAPGDQVIVYPGDQVADGVAVRAP